MPPALRELAQMICLIMMRTAAVLVRTAGPIRSASFLPNQFQSSGAGFLAFQTVLFVVGALQSLDWCYGLLPIMLFNR